MKILLGVCGGIAAYKAAELTRELIRHGFDVQVAMTEGAQRFVTPLTFATLSTHPVLTSMWQADDVEAHRTSSMAFSIEHTSVAQEIDAMLIAPATANTLARLAHGFADDVVTTIALATQSPLFLSPAMNVNMWRHAATQQNIGTLITRGARMIAPAVGSLACGVVGEGRLAEVSEIAATMRDALLKAKDLAGQHVLITAGGTREPIDPVRFLGNRSSGKMGNALAEAAIARGARVTLITAAAPPSLQGCTVVQVDTADEMRQEVLNHLASASIVIMAAAVADYRAAEPQQQKMKKSATLTLELVRNGDVLERVARDRRPDTLVIGFAAETENLLSEARRKLLQKGVDAIVANDVSHSHSGFEADWNEGIFVTPERETVLPRATKRSMSDSILNECLRLKTNPAHPGTT